MCEVIVQYTSCNLLEHEWIRIGIRTIEAQIDEKNKNIRAGKMLLVLIIKERIDKIKTKHKFLQIPV